MDERGVGGLRQGSGRPVVVAACRASSTFMVRSTWLGLESQGLIERHPNPADKRSHRIYVTEAGKERFLAAHKAVDRREAQLEADLTPEQRAAIRTWMSGIGTACQ
ncbi:MarR family winged helix-turn-helix transcriptional regulator [Nocardia huaxiensis]|uniref:MarR family winged helix-turn-helix transcriptional regulator n=1 Tax=Nocardia huaxiensis TaxID=2755382 RepID=UPI001E3B6ADD|nr:hypothetical protein [Nocardia huaxiensis]UFS96684.1 hypothetical protein LPY97_01740 [Nocardia huaxiensis]